MNARRRDTPHERPRPRFASDRARGWASDVGAVATILVMFLVVYRDRVGDLSPTVIAQTYFAAWVLYSVAFVLLTFLTFRKADGASFARWLTETRDQRRRRLRSERRELTGGPVGAVSFCLVALAAVVYCALVPELRENSITVGLAVAVVVASWALILVTYTMHYAREFVSGGGLRIDRADTDGQPTFADFLALSVQVSTGLNSSGISVESRSMRRATSVHAITAFIFNTTIVALLVSVLLTSAAR